MASRLPPRVVVVTRPTEFERLLERHGTAQQAAFFLRTRDQSLDPVRERHERQEAAVTEVAAAIPPHWRRARVGRSDLDRFLFEPEDLVVAVGQDGLVANLAKYIDEQPVIGINPDRDRFEGVLVPHGVEAIRALLPRAAEGAIEIEARTMVRARLDNGEELYALNEVFVGHRSHQSARYEIAYGVEEEAHSSSGLIVATGTGATGWARSIHHSRDCALEMPQPEDPRLVFFVREAWPSVATGIDCVEGIVDEDAPLTLTSRMDVGGTVFGDGIEADRLEFGWGRRVEVGTAERRLRLVR